MKRRRTKSSRVIVSIGLALVLAGTLLASGCLVSKNDVTYGPKGPAIGAGTTRQIKLGQTSKEWLLDRLGEPTSETETAEGTQLLKYVYTKKIDGKFVLFPVLVLDNNKETRTVYYFEIKDDAIIRYWKE